MIADFEKNMEEETQYGGFVFQILINEQTPITLELDGKNRRKKNEHAPLLGSP